MTTISKYQRPVNFILIPMLLLLLVQSGTIAREEAPSDDVKPTNVRWLVKEDIIIVNYDLNASLDARYRVSVVMKREGDESFTIVPKTAEGALGEGFLGGSNKEIRWYFKRDYPQGFKGEGYYFEITVEELSQDSNLLYYALGGAAIVGGVVAFIITKSAGVTATDNLPPPPGRP